MNTWDGRQRFTFRSPKDCTASFVRCLYKVVNSLRFLLWLLVSRLSDVGPTTELGAVKQLQLYAMAERTLVTHTPPMADWALTLLAVWPARHTHGPRGRHNTHWDQVRNMGTCGTPCSWRETWQTYRDNGLGELPPRWTQETNFLSVEQAACQILWGIWIASERQTEGIHGNL
jgi:hypothetical protein